MKWTKGPLPKCTMAAGRSVQVCGQPWWWLSHPQDPQSTPRLFPLCTTPSGVLGTIFFFSLVNIREIFLILKRPTAILKSESTAWVNHLLGHEDCHQRTGTAEGFQFRWHERFQLALVWIIELTWLDHLFDGLIELCVFLKALLCAADEFCLCTETSRWGCWYRQCWNLSVCFL